MPLRPRCLSIMGIGGSGDRSKTRTMLSSYECGMRNSKKVELWKMDLKFAAPRPPLSSGPGSGLWCIAIFYFFFPHMGRAVAEINILHSVD